MATRASTGLRTRSAKAVEAEHTENLLAAARTKQGASAAADSEQQRKEEGPRDPDQQDGKQHMDQDAEDHSGGKQAKKKPPKRKGKKTYCVCQKPERGEMIECEGCKDWFHFDCIGLSTEDADKIQSYACSNCMESKGITTTYAEAVDAATSPAPAEVEQEKPSPSTKGNSKSKSKGAPPTRTSKRKASGKSKESSPPAAALPEAEEDEQESDHGASDHESRTASSDDDSGSDAAPSDDVEDEEVDADYEGEHARKKPRTRPLRSGDQKKKPSLPIPERKASGSLAAPQSPVTPTTPSGLPPARKYVADKMAAVIRTIIGDDMSEADAIEYGLKVEATLFSTLNESVKGKPTAGGRYKAQFNLVHGALSKFSDLNPELIASIRDRTLTPAKVALLNSTELANAEQRAVIDKAEAEALRMHVRIKDDEEPIQAGRDGLEFMQDSRQVEMANIRRQESEARERERRREAGEDEPPSEGSRRTSVDVSQSPVSVVPASPATDKGEKPQSARKTSASTISIPRPSISIDSAWGDKKIGSSQRESIDMGEQEVDLSDMVPDTAFSDEDEQMELDQEEDDLAVIRKQTPGWTGGIVNPAVQTPPAPIELRHLAASPQPPTYWSRLIAQPNITITGRVPSAASLKYLSDRRMDRSKQLQPALLSLSPKASQADKDAFAALVDFHISRDRHGIFHPFGDRPPPGTAREVYLIPLRGGDVVPPLLGELGASVPESRHEPVVVAVFLAPAPQAPGAPHMRSPMDRPPVPQSPFPPVPQSPFPPPMSHGPPPPPGPRRGPPSNAPTGPRAAPPSAPIGPKATVAAAASAGSMLPNAQLQALMASLDANAIASVAKSPPTGGNSPAPGPPRPPPAMPPMPSAPVPGMPPFPPGSLAPPGPFPPPPAPGYAYPGYGGGGQSPYDPNPGAQQNQSPYDPYDQNNGGYSPSGYQQDSGGYSPSGYQRSPRWG